MSLKITDTSEGVSNLGRADQYWHLKGFRSFYKSIRPGANIPLKADASNLNKIIIDEFKIKNIEFGNWVTNEDRFNYLAGLHIALQDLNNVLRFNKNIGMDHNIAIAFGARGQGSASAHYEPSTKTINITRYDTTSDKQKPFVFASSGGMGALAHEYGHALDYFFGQHIEQRSGQPSLTMGRSTVTRFENKEKKNTMRYWTNEIILNIIYILPNSKVRVKTKYYEKLQGKFSNDYWFRQNELFARAFEQYIQHKLKAKKITNRLLAKTKYETDAYMSEMELKRIVPLFDKLISMMADRAKK